MYDAEAEVALASARATLASYMVSSATNLEVYLNNLKVATCLLSLVSLCRLITGGLQEALLA